MCQVVWYQDTMKLMDSSHLHMINVGDSHRLSILNIDPGHWDTYHCSASNNLGDNSVSITLTGINIS